MARSSGPTSCLPAYAPDVASLGHLAIIGAGGFIGAVLRYLVAGWLQRASGSILFPFGTLGVNLIGCYCIGALAWLVEARSLLGPETRMFVMIGLLGAFTTFSTFGNETLELLRHGRSDLALVNIGVHVVAGLAMVWLGRGLAALIWR